MRSVLLVSSSTGKDGEREEDDEVLFDSDEQSRFTGTTTADETTSVSSYDAREEGLGVGSSSRSSRRGR